MKQITFTIFAFLLLLTPTFAADAARLFGEIPSGSLKDVDRGAAIVENDAARGFLKLKFPKDFSGEFKILSTRKDETVVGLSVYSCADSDLEIWRVKKSVWTNITDAAAPKLGKSDVIAMLRVSPASIDKLNQEVTIPYFFGFPASGSDLQLNVRRQSGCEIAGVVYDYRFNGKKFSRK